MNRSVMFRKKAGGGEWCLKSMGGAAFEGSVLGWNGCEKWDLLGNDWYPTEEEARSRYFLDLVDEDHRTNVQPEFYVSGSKPSAGVLLGFDKRSELRMGFDPTDAKLKLVSTGDPRVTIVRINGTTQQVASILCKL